MSFSWASAQDEGGGPGKIAFNSFDDLTRQIQQDTRGSAILHAVAEAQKNQVWKSSAGPGGGHGPSRVSGHGGHKGVSSGFRPRPRPLTGGQPYAIDQKNSQGKTLLMIAAQYGFNGVAQALIEEFGADKYILDDEGKAAYDLALQNHHKELAQFLAIKEKLI